LEKNNILVIVLIVIMSLIVGGAIGSFLFPQKDTKKIMDDECKEYYIRYERFTEAIQDHLLPFNETDNVTATMQGNVLKIDHTVPNERGLKYIDIGFTEDGFYKYISQSKWRN
jgi:hypothetical protein